MAFLGQLQTARRRVGRVVALALAAGGLACGPGDGSELDERGRPLAYPFAPGTGSRIGAAVFGPTYEDVALEFLEPLCADCHAGASASEGLDLTLEGAYDDMVEAYSLQRSNLMLVEPGEPDRSYLIIKMEGGSRMTGRIMPRGRAARPQGEIDVVRQWIADGAERN